MALPLFKLGSEGLVWVRKQQNKVRSKRPSKGDNRNSGQFLCTKRGIAPDSSKVGIEIAGLSSSNFCIRSLDGKLIASDWHNV
ncbi:hypothetical protein BABINDRAFT_120656 [Babjeviella inositovora NRRL Y-12698]|uniref:Uncharacterized protein n=1 Tax=Babjeviella inositovora NRRL Y-12698 TaxID=984486 RepID=A0A1E3QTY1_9ASCO|nr:uncharacterized protein BABINDRAFT_120656 [Babjeviella inositovora NRRL Y-12698]ODQ81148.1 hypothetical protein BABINDRAFT_120656 [Babjeviella inositovora NRRL Y-12698]